MPSRSNRTLKFYTKFQSEYEPLIPIGELKLLQIFQSLFLLVPLNYIGQGYFGFLPDYL